MSVKFQLPPPSVEAQQKYILAKLARIQPATFCELLGFTGYPDVVLAVRLEEMIAERKVAETRLPSRSYYSLWRGVRL